MFDFLGTDLSKWVELAVSIVGLFALIATMTPTEADNKIANVLTKLVHTLGANFGKAKNAE